MAASTTTAANTTAGSSDLLRLQVIDPRRTVLDRQVQSVNAPGVMGELGILPGHVPLLTTLSSGILTYQEGGEARRLAVHYGFMQVRDDAVYVLPHMVEQETEIDLPRAQRAAKRAHEFLAETRREANAAQRSERYEAKLKRALVRQALVQSTPTAP